jgi:hypothetical protein
LLQKLTKRSRQNANAHAFGLTSPPLCRAIAQRLLSLLLSVFYLKSFFLGFQRIIVAIFNQDSFLGPRNIHLIPF